MKKSLILAGILSIGYAYTQQKSVGINTHEPKATLQIVGDPTVATHFDGIIAPRITGDQLKAKNYGTEQTGALVYVSTAATTPEGQTINVKSAGYYYFDGNVWQTTKPLVYSAGKGVAISTNNEISRTGFEEVTEDGKTGWRLIGRDANNYGNIGTGALDASYSNEASTTRGATGNYSVAVGQNTTASGIASFAAGNNSTAAGVNSTAMGNSAFVSGENSIALGYSLVTGNNSIAIGTYRKNEITSHISYAFGNGNQLKSSSSGNYAFGESNKILETSTSTYAIGQSNTINTNSSYALGASNTITGYGSVAIGYETKAEGHHTFAWGKGAIATGQVPIAIGREGNQLTISDTGNVGIGLGAAAATAKLEVNGSIKLQPQNNLPRECTNGQILFHSNQFYGCLNNSWKTFTLVD